MLTIQDEKEQLLDAMLQMPRRKLEQFVARAFSLKARERTAALSEREAELLFKINKGLLPATQRRLKLLTELADMRKVPLRKLIKQLGLKPAPHD